MNTKFIVNVIKVVASNVLILLSSLLVAFVLPKIMPVEEYGTYKEFTLYFSYAGILHLGFVDAVFIKYGGVNLKEVNRNELKAYTSFFLLMQTALFFILCVSALIIGIPTSGQYSFFIISIAFAYFSANITTYFQYLSQAVERFNELTIRNFIKAFISASIVITLWLLHKYNLLDLVSAKIYILCFLATNTGIALWYLITYHKYSFASPSSIKKAGKSIIGMFKIGFPIMVAASASNLILISDRQFAVLLTGKEEYAMYAFAYNFATLVITLVSAISIVFFPALKKESTAIKKSSYCKVMFYISFISFAFGCFLIPIRLFVNYYLPAYSSSLQYVSILIPAVCLNIIIATVNINYYKALLLGKRYLLVSVFVLAFAIASNGIAFLITKSLYGLSVASVLTFLLWLTISTYDLKKKMNIVEIYPFVYSCIMVLVFYFSYSITNSLGSFLTYTFVWLFASSVFFIHAQKSSKFQKAFSLIEI